MPRGRRPQRRRKRGETEGQFLLRCAKLDQDAARKERARATQRRERKRVEQTRTERERTRTAETRPTADPIYVRAFPDGESWADATGQIEQSRIQEETYKKWQNRFASFTDSVSEDEGAQDPWEMLVPTGGQNPKTDYSKTTTDRLIPDSEGADTPKPSESHDDALRNFVRIYGFGPAGETLDTGGTYSHLPSSVSPPPTALAAIAKIVFHIHDLTHLGEPLKIDAPRAVLTYTRARDRGRSLFASAGSEPCVQLPDPPALRKARVAPPPEPPATEPVAPAVDPAAVSVPPAVEVPWHETILQAVLVRWLKRVRQESRGPIAVRLSSAHRFELLDAYERCRDVYLLGALGRDESLPDNCPAFALMMSRVVEALRLVADVASSDGLMQTAHYVRSAAMDQAQVVRCRVAVNRPSAEHRAYRETVRTEIEAGRLAVLVDDRKEKHDERRTAS